MAPFLFKIKYGEDTLRRLNVSQKSSSSEPDLTFKDLELKIREMFGIDSSQDLLITYIDSDNDTIAMCEDQDLFDACVIQGLSTLQLEVKAIEQTPDRNPNGEAFLRHVLPFLTPDGIKNLLKDYDPLITEAIEAIIKSLTDSTTSACPKETESPSQDDNKAAPSDPDACGRKREAEQETFGRINFHRGVQCDECGMTPILGPRFKSIKKDDYDLCYSCYLDMGNEVDYQRIDRPLQSRRHPPCGPRRGKVHPRENTMPRMPMDAPPFNPFFPRGPHGWKFNSQRPFDFQRCTRTTVNNDVGKEQTVGKLDSRFVCDVTIFDGTELAPGTPFTKIWRLRNIGFSNWPKETKLVFVGGDVLSSDLPVNLELSEEGLAPDEEIDASVELIAPGLPGRYVSNWRLMTPSCHQFGHRIWVLIQVVPKGEQSPQVHESLLPVQQVGDDNIMVEISGDKRELDMNGKVGSPNRMDQVLETAIAPHFELLTLEKTATKENQLKQRDHVDDPLGTLNSEVGGFSIVEKPVEADSLSPRQMSPTFMDCVNVSEQDQEENIEHASDGTTLSENLSLDISGSHPEVSIIKEKQKQKHEEELEMSSVREDVQAIFEETLLEQLELMGFSQRTLNLVLLKKNKNNLQSTIEDLVVASEWEPILLELEEMGFVDKELNVRLMFKNNGSVKRVVKELVQMQVLATASVAAAVKGKEKAL